MAYTTVASVQALLPTFQIAESSTPSITWVSAEIDLVTKSMDNAMRIGGGTAPATDADVLGALDRICSREVAWQVVAIKGGDSDKAMMAVWHQEYVDAMATMATTGSPVGSGSSSMTASSYTMDSPSDTDDSINPKFEMGKDY